MLTVQAIPDKLVEHGVALTTIMDAVSETLDDGLLQFNPGNFTGTGGFIDTPNQRFVIRHVPPVVGVDDLSHVTVPGRDGQAVPLTEVVELVARPSAADRRRRHQRRAGRHAHRREVPVGEHARRDARRRGGARRAASRACPASTSTTRSSARPASSSRRSTTCRMRCSSAACWSFVVLIVFLFEWRTALISLVAIPLSLMAAAMVLYVRDVDDQHDDPGGLRHLGGRRRRRRDHRRREHHPPPAPGAARGAARGRPRRSSSTSSLEVRSAIVYATLIDVVAVSPVFFISGLSGCVLPAAGHLLRAGRPRVAGRRADGHAGAGLHPAAQRADRAPAIAHHPAAPGRLRPRLIARILRTTRPGLRDRRRGQHGRVSASGRSSASRCCPTSRNATS